MSFLIVDPCLHAMSVQTHATSWENDSIPLWPLDRACHQNALVAPYEHFLLARLTAFHLPYQYYISIYLINPL